MKAFSDLFTVKKPIVSRFFNGDFLKISQIAILATVTMSGVAYSESIPMKSVNLATAISQTMSMHPELKSFAAQAEIYQGYAQQAGISVRPEVEFVLEDALGTGEHSGIKSAQSTLSISWLLDNSIVKNRVKTAKVRGSTVAIEREIKALDLAAQTTRYFIQVLVNEEQLKLAKLSLMQAVISYDAVSKRVKAGKSSLVDKLKSQAEVSKKELLVEDLTHEVDASKYQLLAQWNGQGVNGEHKKIKIVGSLLSLAPLTDIDSLFSNIKQLPSVNLFATKQRIAQSEIELARIESKPLWQFSTGLRRYEATDDYGLVAGVSIPLGSSNQNQGRINALRASQQGLATESQALIHQLNTQLYILIEQMKHSEHVIHSVSTDVIPVLEQAYTEAEKAYKLGRYSYTEWINTQKDLLDAQSDLIAAYQNAHLNNIEIERLTGTSLFNINKTFNAPLNPKSLAKNNEK